LGRAGRWGERAGAALGAFYYSAAFEGSAQS
jgi:hypothetical protein